MNALAAIIKILSTEAAVPALLFVILYAKTQPWWRSAVGRHLMSFMAVCAVVLSLVIVSAIFGREYPGHLFVRAAAWIAINFIFWWRLAILVKVVLKKYPDPLTENGKTKEK